MKHVTQVHEFLETSARLYLEKKVVWDKQKWYTYKELNQTADALSVFLVQSGITRGERVAILHENSYEYIAAYFGILKAGAVVVGLNTETTAEALEYLLTDSDCRCLITQKKQKRLFLPALKNCPLITHIVLTDNDPGVFDNLSGATVETLSSIKYSFKKPVLVRSIDIDLAEIVYTSGSTGKPKGVMLTHLNLVSNMRSICAYLNLTKEDRVMVILPFYYIYGKSLLLTHILVGGSIVIDNRFVYPNKVLETMEKTKVTGFAGVPSTFLILLNRSSLKDTTFAKLRYVTQAGGALAPAIQKELIQAFAPAEIFIMYGTTEAAPRLSWLDPKFLFSKCGSIGTPVDNVDLLIVDDEGKELPRGEVGEIAARGSNIMQGYWKDTEETDRVLRHGMYFTGDLGKQDEEGFFYVVGRTKDIVKVKGFRVSAKEIEETIQEIEDVHETAVIGVDDPILGEAIMAFIIPKKKGWKDEQKIKEHLQYRLPPLKQPKYIKFRDSFPKNESGKILKSILKEEEEEENNTVKEI